MNIRLALFLSLVPIVSAMADDQIARVQQELKDQGFYYGEVTGEKNADTTAAIRRFQIRGGLQITGDLNDETIKALASAKSPATTNTPAVASGTPAATTRAPSPLPRQDNSDLRDSSRRYAEEEEETAPRYAPPPAGPDRQEPVYPGRAVPIPDGNFARTPYQGAPPEVQQDVIARAQKKLAKRELYRGPIDGAFNPDLEFSLRAYQSRVGLPTTGRLDLETLAALELLPGANQPVFVPRRGIGQPPVRGEWVRP